MKTVALVVNPVGDKDFTYSENIASYLVSQGIDVLCDKENVVNATYVKSYDEMFEKADMGITLGGDGTLLRIAKYASKNNVPILGMNLGRLGFLVELEKDETDGIDKILKGNYIIENKIMLKASVLRNGKEVLNCHALNDIVVAKGNMAKMIHLNLEIDGTNVNDYFADGVIFATPTGSTAYSMSAGGPVLHSSLDAVTITPVCPHTMTSRPLVIGSEQKIKVTTDPKREEQVILYADGIALETLKAGDAVLITKSEYKTGLIRTQNKNFFEILNKKLSERK